MTTMVRALTVDWLVVAAVFVSFLVIPAVLIYAPPPLPYRLTLLILPLGPAIGLAAIAVWFARRRGRDGANPNP